MKPQVIFGLFALVIAAAEIATGGASLGRGTAHYLRHDTHPRAFWAAIALTVAIGAYLIWIGLSG